MRSLLVNNEDLLRTNTQLTNEMKRMREQMIEMEREIQTMGEKYRAMEVCVAGWMDGWMLGTVVVHVFARLTVSLICADRGEGGPGRYGGGQHSGVRLQFPPAVPSKQDPGR